MARSGKVVEAVEGPDDNSCHVHQHCQHIAARQHLVKWCRKESQKAADGKNDDKKGKNEADGINSNTPLEPWKIKFVVSQADEDDTGHKGLQNLQESWDCGKKSTDLSRFGSGQPNLNSIQDEGQDGGHCGTDRSAAAGASKEDRIDDGRCQHLYERMSKGSVK